MEARLILILTRGDKPRVVFNLSELDYNQQTTKWRD